MVIRGIQLMTKRMLRPPRVQALVIIHFILSGHGFQSFEGNIRHLCCLLFRRQKSLEMKGEICLFLSFSPGKKPETDHRKKAESLSLFREDFPPFMVYFIWPVRKLPSSDHSFMFQMPLMLPER